jgi:hypothetical protein
MIDPELPPELAELERLLAARERPLPSADFGRRVLAAARAAAGRQAAPAAGWRFWASVAAALLFGTNLAMSVAADTDWHLLDEPTTWRVDSAAERLRVLAPELGEEEIRRQALLARAGAGLSAILCLEPTVQHLRNLEERERWGSY